MLQGIDGEKIFEPAGAIVRNTHVELTHELHTATYIDKDAIYAHPLQVRRLCMIIAGFFRTEEVHVVIGPAMGGIVLAHVVADHLNQGSGDKTAREVLALYAEKDGNQGFTIRPTYRKFIHGANVLVVEDILTTGASAGGVVQVVRQLGGYVVGVGALWNRRQVTKDDLGGVPLLFSVVEKTFEDWPQQTCPLCRKNIPLSNVLGKRKR